MVARVETCVEDFRVEPEDALGDRSRVGLAGILHQVVDQALVGDAVDGLRSFGSGDHVAAQLLQHRVCVGAAVAGAGGRHCRRHRRPDIIGGESAPVRQGEGVEQLAGCGGVLGSLDGEHGPSDVTFEGVLDGGRQFHAPCRRVGVDRLVPQLRRHQSGEKERAFGGAGLCVHRRRQFLGDERRVHRIVDTFETLDDVRADVAKRGGRIVSQIDGLGGGAEGGQ